MENIQWIQDMTAENLAEFLARNTKCKCCVHDPVKCEDTCRNGILKWLESEKEECNLES
jgi:hypothetical protein